MDIVIVDTMQHIMTSLLLSTVSAVFFIRVVLASALSSRVCLFVHMSQVGILLKWLNVGSHKQLHVIAQRFVF